MANRLRLEGQYSRFLRLASVLAVLGMIQIEPGAAASNDKDGFVKDVRAQNAHHLKNSPSLPKNRKPQTAARDWEDKITRRAWDLRDGPVHVAIRLKKSGPPDGLLYQAPVVTVSVAGKNVIKAEGAESFPDNPVFVVQIAEMDPGNPHPEVLMSVYTGGAHCCSDTRILTSSRDGRTWKEVEAGLFDGGPLEARDLDGDGRYELAMRDNAFLYAFGCYACSTAPLHVLRLQKGQMINVSANPAFRNWHIDSLRRIIEWADEDANRNGFLAGYVGQKILLGEGAQAWKLMLKHHDTKDDWGLDHCKVKRNDKGECPPGQVEMLKFPDALERFLNEAGYTVEK